MRDLARPDLFDEVEKQAEGGSKTRASWTGVLSIQLPALNLGNVEYHLRAGKAKGSQEKPRIRHIDSQTGREVASREVVRFYRYTQGPDGQRSEPIEISYEEMKGKVRYPSTDGQDWLLSGRKESRYFDVASLTEGEWVEVPANQPSHRPARHRDGRALRQNVSHRDRGGELRSPVQTPTPAWGVLSLHR